MHRKVSFKTSFSSHPHPQYILGVGDIRANVIYLLVTKLVKLYIYSQVSGNATLGIVSEWKRGCRIVELVPNHKVAKLNQVFLPFWTSKPKKMYAALLKQLKLQDRGSRKFLARLKCCLTVEKWRMFCVNIFNAVHVVIGRLCNWILRLHRLGSLRFPDFSFPHCSSGCFCRQPVTGDFRLSSNYGRLLNC